MKVSLLILILIGSQLPAASFASSSSGCLSSFSKLKLEQNVSNGVFKILLGDMCTIQGPSVATIMTLRLDQEGTIQSRSVVTFSGHQVQEVSFNLTKDNLARITNATYSPVIIVADREYSIGNFQYDLNCLSFINQYFTASTEYPPQAGQIEVFLRDNCINTLPKSAINSTNTKMYIEQGSDTTPWNEIELRMLYPGTFTFDSGLRAPPGASYTPLLKVEDSKSNIRYFYLGPVKFPSFDWTNSIKTCVYSTHIKTVCDSFPSVEFNFCSPLPDYKISRNENGKWLNSDEIFSVEKDLDICKSTAPYPMGGREANYSKTKSVIIKYKFLATPTQRAQTWTFTIKTVKK